MLVTSALRSAFADPARRLLPLMAGLLLALGVVTVHTTGATATSHHGDLTVATASQHLSGAIVDVVAGALDDAGEHCAHGCGVHELSAAMCLIAMVSVFALAAPRSLLLMGAGPRSSPGPHARPPGAPATQGACLHALGISRT